MLCDVMFDDKLHYLKGIFIQDFIADSGMRDQGFGSLMMKQLIQYAQVLNAQYISGRLMACDRLRYKLWNGRAWRNKTCKRNCPLADYCQKETVAINGERLCRGQVYSRGINSEKAEQLPNDTPIYRADGSACYLKSDDPEAFGNFFEILFEVGYNYGDPKRAGNRLMGGNVIWQLYKTALNAKGEH